MWKWLVMLIALPTLKLIGTILAVRDNRRRLWSDLTGGKPAEPDPQPS